jgi:hypothetical protein
MKLAALEFPTGVRLRVDVLVVAAEEDRARRAGGADVEHHQVLLAVAPSAVGSITMLVR